MASDRKLRILWFSNLAISENECSTTGTWLQAMANEFSKSEDIILGNVVQASVKRVQIQFSDGIQQWLIPRVKGPHDTPSSWGELLLSIIKEFSPDLIHIWGVESNWNIKYVRSKLSVPFLLGIQGLKGVIAQRYSGDLLKIEIIRSIGIKEIVLGTTIRRMIRKFKKWDYYENGVITASKYINVQSKWVEAIIKSINPHAVIFHNEHIIRKQFHAAGPWHYNGNPRIFYISAYPAPFKGLHVAVRALAILQKKYPSIELRIAGWHPRFTFKRDGYIHWVYSEIERLGLELNIKWLNSITAEQIANELENCSAIVIPSFIESYSVALAEAMLIGTPSVVSYAGGMPSLATDEESALFFSPGDHNMCSFQLDRILSDKQLAHRLSRNARMRSLSRHSTVSITGRQLDIYRTVINLDCNGM